MVLKLADTFKTHTELFFFNHLGSQQMHKGTFDSVLLMLQYIVNIIINHNNNNNDNNMSKMCQNKKDVEMHKIRILLTIRYYHYIYRYPLMVTSFSIHTSNKTR